MGHQHAFPRPGPNGWCRFGQETFAGVRGNGRDAPIADLAGAESVWTGANHAGAVLQLMSDPEELTLAPPRHLAFDRRHVALLAEFLDA